MIPPNNAELYRKALFEQTLIRRHFPFLETRITGLALICRGSVKPTEQSGRYKIEIVHTGVAAPQVRILNPTIEFSSEIHMYRNGTLCLYDWREQPWQRNWRLHETVIPWTAEWLVFYELFLLTGRWLGKAAEHGEPKA